MADENIGTTEKAPWQERLAAKDVFGLHGKASQAPALSPSPETGGDTLAPEAGSETLEQADNGLFRRDEHPSDENADPESTSEQVDDPAEESETDTDEGRVNSLNDLATSLDTDVNTLLGLRVTARVDGDDHDVTLGEILNSYRLESQVNKRSTQLGEQRVALEAEHAKKLAEADAALEQTGQFLQFAQQQMIGEVSQVNLEELSQTDPVEANRQLFLMQQKKAIFDQKVAEFQQAQQQRAAQIQQAQHAAAQAERERLPQAIPEWMDATRMKQEVGAIEKYLTGMGVPAERLQQIQSADELAIIRKAWMWDKLQDGKGKVLRKVAKAPKGLKSGTRDAGVKLTNVDTARARLKKGGTKQDAVAVMRAKRAQAAKQRRRSTS